MVKLFKSNGIVLWFYCPTTAAYISVCHSLFRVLMSARLSITISIDSTGLNIHTALNKVYIAISRSCIVYNRQKQGSLLILTCPFFGSARKAFGNQHNANLSLKF
jgi:hypothetical protein